MTDKEGLRYVVVGESRSGMIAVADVLNNHRQATCFIDLFERKAETRKKAHESYFGESCASLAPGWFCLGDEQLENGLYTNPREYIYRVLTNGDANVVGLCVPYKLVYRYELCELFAELAAVGDFCMLHVIRNPLECLVSLLQAEQTGVWRSTQVKSSKNLIHMPVQPLATEVEQFIEQHLFVRDKLSKCMTDGVEIHYPDLQVLFQAVCRRLFEFLELPSQRGVCKVHRLVDEPMWRRVSSLDYLKNKVAKAFRQFFEELES